MDESINLSGRPLDRAVAVDVFGWMKTGKMYRDIHDDGGEWWGVPPGLEPKELRVVPAYHQDLALAFAAADRIAAMCPGCFPRGFFYALTCDCLGEFYEAAFFCRKLGEDSTINPARQEGATKNEALLRATLAAVLRVREVTERVDLVTR